MEEITVVTSDGLEMKISKKLLEKSETLKNLYQDSSSGTSDPLGLCDSLIIPNVSSYILVEIDKIINQEVAANQLPVYPEDFTLLIELTLAFNFLDMPEELAKICKKHAQILKDKSPQEIRELYNLEDDLTAEEKEQILKDNTWAISEDS